MSNEQRRPDLTKPLEDVLADFARDLDIDIHQVWRAYEMAHRQVQRWVDEIDSRSDPEAGLK